MSKYHELLHAMQSGVEFSRDKNDQTPKQLRVGVNAALSDAGGLATLLISKGVFTKEEYELAITQAMAREVENYRHKIADEIGSSADKINLS